MQASTWKESIPPEDSSNIQVARVPRIIHKMFRKNQNYTQASVWLVLVLGHLGAYVKPLPGWLAGWVAG